MIGPLAQLVEHLTLNQVAVGSNPTRLTKENVLFEMRKRGNQESNVQKC